MPVPASALPSGLHMPLAPNPPISATVFAIVACGVLLGAALSSDLIAQQRSDTTVRQLGAPLHRGRGTIIEELTVGAGKTGAEYDFSTIVSLTIGRDGSIFVVESRGLTSSGTSSVRKFDGQGVFIRQFGRPGQGPGEYRSPADVVELADGRVLVSEPLAIHVYSASATPLESWNAVRHPSNVGPAMSLEPAGIVRVNTSTRRDEAIASRPMSVSAMFRNIVVRIRADGSVLDTLVQLGEEFPKPQRMDRVDVPFVPRFLYERSPLGYDVTMYTASYAIDLRVSVPSRGAASLWRPGDPVVSLRRNGTQVPVQNVERSDWRQSIEAFMRSPSAGGSLGWQWNGPDIPRVKPLVRALRIADDGRIWVQLHQPATLDASVEILREPNTNMNAGTPIPSRNLRRWAEPVVYDILEPGGVYVGQVSLPSSVSVRAIRGDTLWGVVTDSDGIQQLKRYRINWGG